METTINQRFKIFAGFKNLSRNELVDVLGLSPGSVTNLFNGHTAPQPKTLEKIFKAYPELNRVWLLTGEGEMIKIGQKSKAVKKSTNYVTEEAFELLSNEVQLLRQSITKLMGRLENFPISPLKTGKKLDLNIIQGVYSGDVTYKQSA